MRNAAGGPLWEVLLRDGSNEEKMHDRRDALKLGMALAGGSAAASATALAEGGRQVPQSGLVFPDTAVPSIISRPSPPVVPFQDPLYRMPVAQPLPLSAFNPPPDPQRHQRYNEFVPVKLYQQEFTEIRWRYSSQAPFGNGATGYDPTAQSGSWSYSMNKGVPGETFHAKYGEPVLIRRINNLPGVGDPNRKVGFALPSITLHLHNGHTASESDGLPMDFFDPGEFWDYHYANFPAGFDKDEIMSTLWYHDHRLDFTAPNVYAGNSGFYLLFDDRDTNNENDNSGRAFRLPSGNYDIPLIFHDVQFDQTGQVIWDFFGPNPIGTDPKLVSKYGTDPFHPLPGQVPLGSPNLTDNFTFQDEPAILPAMQRGYTLKGMTGDRFTVNRTIQPFLNVEPRKYRFRMLNGGPSRLYNFWLRTEQSSIPASAQQAAEKFIVISTDGNLLEAPLVKDNVEIWVAQRHDVIIDFSSYNPGDKIRLINDLEMRPDGAGPLGGRLSQPDEIMEFRVVPLTGPDRSRIPATMRKLPRINFNEVRRRRLFVFDYDNGLWTVNGQLMDPNRIDAKIEQGSAEIWTFRNTGAQWAHPIHTHFEEFQILEVNGRDWRGADNVERARKDVISLRPEGEVTFFGRWRDFLGKHVMHCHNVVHEDHAMMIRWDIVPPGQGD